MRTGATIFLFLFVAAMPPRACEAATREQSASPVPDEERKAWAQELLARARLAVGGDGVLHGIRTFSASGKLRTFIKYILVKSPTRVEERHTTLKGRIKIEFLMPDKSRRSVSSSTLRGGRDSYTEVTNGDRAWRNPPLTAVSSRREKHVVDVSDFEKSLAFQAQSARLNLALYSLAWLIQAPPGLKFEYRYVGQLKSGSGMVDVIEVTAADGSSTYFLLDQQTHRPLGFDLAFVASLRDPILVDIAPFDRNYMQRLLARARQERMSRSGPPRRFTLHIRFSDFRRSNGILLPYRMTTSVDEQPYEELVMSGFSVNGNLSPRLFERPASPKPK